MTDMTRSTYAGLRPLAVRALGQTGADIERLVREARQSARRQRRLLTWQDLDIALQGRRKRMPDDVLWRVCLHEAGHAIAWSLLGVGEVLSVTVGVENLGQVLTRRRNDMAQTETWLRQTMACLLGGRVSERMVLGDVVAGAGGDDTSDLAQATDYALAAETSLGFSRINPLLYRNPSGSLDLLSLDRELAARVNERLISAETLALELLTSHCNDLLEIASRLQERGVMEGREIRQVLGLAEPGMPEP